MIEHYGDIWEFSEAHWLMIPTNGIVKRDGKAVMGAGLAKQCKEKVKDADITLGKWIKRFNNHINFIGYYKPPGMKNDKFQYVFSFPTKYDWREKSEFELLERSCGELKTLWRMEMELDYRNEDYPIKVALPMVGCGEGGLKWTDVAPIVHDYLPEDQFIILIK